MNGILLAFQFFTAIPVQKELPLGRKEVTAMYVALPFVGALIGLAMYGVSVLLTDYVGLGTLLASVFIVLAGIVLTGGLHLDGWADTSDAFFSYRDRAKRLEILEDPRLGAFGAMGLMLLILVKIALFNEILLRGTGDVAYFIAIPFLARAAMTIYFTTVCLAKDKGMAHFFKEKMSGKVVSFMSMLSSVSMLLVIGFILNDYLVPTVLFAVLVAVLLIYRRWSLKHFGGVTGDLSGAFIEGTEALLWLTVIILM
ncbi:adenosylcobinamide-GDP ribazoletransferase [Sporosarcina limicola]|uniref:Adenosylcobinamide-GDP ribazoletransferase n=1 Tax=Sporosarcina limicola TaxID=34101 RepID=A0A927MJH1_9BACL|nr:adenosylcobinamide-GDP ribazoletransferase [Sporosarcina limicola]MBE1555743.1 adenosylcobinamide-GDP ribazoletransferase [Sporosarcina limicola]